MPNLVSPNKINYNFLYYAEVLMVIDEYSYKMERDAINSKNLKHG